MMQTQSSTPFYNVQHAPVGAFASFTLGTPGARGGMGLELGKPADESVYIGFESRNDNTFEAFPFFKGSENTAARFDQNASAKQESLLRSFPENGIRRSLNLASDTWEAGDISCKIFSPHPKVPDPETASPSLLKDAVIPAIFAEITLDNRRGKKSRLAFFGYQGSDRSCGMRRLDSVLKKGLVGIGQGVLTAIVSGSPGISSTQGFTIEDILKDGLNKKALTFGLGTVGALLMTVPPRQKRTFRFALCFHRTGLATAGLSSRYYYTKFFPTIESVAERAWALVEKSIEQARKSDLHLTRSSLSPEQRWMLSHAIHSYYASTQFLETDEGPFWIVNEGEYRMMNTFDLTVDQLFFEMRKNPWTVRNELDWFARRFSYRDKARFPKLKKEYPGGISFTHDMGIANTVWHRGTSSYELSGLHGCFSHMTHEELVNWVLCALVYSKQNKDLKWAKRSQKILTDCLQSMANRDHPFDNQRRGIMRLDGSRCEGGSEITTYDSLDASLGQARGNLYLAIKCWAAYVGLAWLLPQLGSQRAASLALRQADRCALTVANSLRPSGYLPAVLDEGVESRILPIVEGLVFPHELGLHQALSESGPYRDMIRAIKTHIQNVLVPGVCLFSDGGMKISSTSDNSWLSKVYLCQFIIREILGLRDKSLHQRADQAHVSWLLHPEESYWAWSDQMINGVARGSKYYPRGVTSILWLQETQPPASRSAIRAGRPPSKPKKSSKAALD